MATKTVKIDPQKAAKIVLWIVIAIIVFFVVFFIVSAFSGAMKGIKKLFGLDDSEGGEDVADEVWKPTEYIPDGGSVASDFNVDFWCTRLNDVLNDWGQMSPWATDRCKTVKAVNELNDNQIIAIANRYFALFGKRLYKDLEEVWTSGCDFANPTKELRERLTRLKVR